MYFDVLSASDHKIYAVKLFLNLIYTFLCLSWSGDVSAAFIRIRLMTSNLLARENAHKCNDVIKSCTHRYF